MGTASGTGSVWSVQRNPDLVRLGASPMAAVQDRARALRDRGEDLIDFSIGDPREPTPPAVREALIEAVPIVSQYPTTRGLADLRAAIAGYVHRRTGSVIDADTQVLPTSGSKEAIFSTALAFVDRTRRPLVAFPTPGYPIYERGAALAGAEPYPIELDGDFVLRSEQLDEAEWRRAALVWTCHPHNPSGAVTPAPDLQRLVEQSRASETWLCVDECYLDLYEGDPVESVLGMAGNDLTGVLSFLSLSKRSGMTGYRSGAIVGDAEAIRMLTALRTSTGSAPPEFTQAAATVAWSDDTHVAERRDVFARKRSIVRSAFADAGYEVVGSRAGIYVWVRVDDDLDATARLLESGVVVAPGRAFGAGGEGYLRLALVPKVEECRSAAERVIACLTGS